MRKYFGYLCPNISFGVHVHMLVYQFVISLTSSLEYIWYLLGQAFWLHQSRGYNITNKKQFCVAMINDIVNLFWCKFVENWYCYSPYVNVAKNAAPQLALFRPQRAILSPFCTPLFSNMCVISLFFSLRRDIVVLRLYNLLKHPYPNGLWYSFLHGVKTWNVYIFHIFLSLLFTMLVIR